MKKHGLAVKIACLTAASAAVSALLFVVTRRARRGRKEPGRGE